MGLAKDPFLGWPTITWEPLGDVSQREVLDLKQAISVLL